MKRDGLNGLISFALNISSKIDIIRDSIYASEAIEDEDEILQRIMPLEKLAEHLNNAVRSLDESNLTPDEILRRELEGIEGPEETEESR